MAHAVDYQALTVLLEEIIAQEDAMDVQTLMAAERGEMLRRAAEEMDRQRQPVRVERYVEHTIPLYNDHEFKSHFRMEKGSFEVSNRFLKNPFTE